MQRRVMLESMRCRELVFLSSKAILCRGPTDREALVARSLGWGRVVVDVRSWKAVGGTCYIGPLFKRLQRMVGVNLGWRCCSAAYHGLG